MPEFIVELLVVVEANSRTDAEVMGERAAREAAQASPPASVTHSRILNVILADVRSADE